MRTTATSFFAICTVVAAGNAKAQDNLVIDLQPIIVSGGFTPMELQRYGRSASVLTARDIEERGITSVQNALRSIPGLAVNGSGDSFTQVRIRGGEGNHTLILIDGIEATGGDGEYILTGLDTANIERIEVLRGPQSVFYGSNASSGVINIITKKGNIGQEYGGSLELGADGWRASAPASTRTDRGGLSLSLAHDQDDGYDQSGDGGEEDGIRRSTLQLSGDYLVTPELKLGFTFRKADEEYDNDSTSWSATDAASYVVDDAVQYSERDERLGQVFAEYEMLGGRMKHRLSYERTDYDQSYNGGTPTETQTTSAKYLLSYAIDGGQVVDASHLLNAMLEWEEDTSSSNPAYNRESNSVALEYRGSFGNGLDIQLGARFDDNKVFDDATT